MTRVRPTKSQYKRLLEANANRCCVCKRDGVGFHLHHIDGDNSNTVDGNLAVLCVEDHDRHHRPSAYYQKPLHTELSSSELLSYKADWEGFVADARCSDKKVVATISAFGNHELIHSLQLVMQWPDERIAMSKSYHLLDGNLDRLTDQIIADAHSIGSNVQVVLINEPLPVEHCPCCGAGFSRTLNSAVVARETDPEWVKKSSASIYVNPTQPSLALVIAFGDELGASFQLHLCQGRFLHFSGEGVDERIRVATRPSVRTQASRIVEKALQEWKPATVFYGTGDAESPRFMSKLHLPRCWENVKKSKRHNAARQKKK